MEVIAVDVGGTYLRVALFSDGNLVEKVKELTPRSGGKLRIAERIAELVRLMGEPERVGVAVAGLIDVRRGEVLNMPNNPIRSFPLKGPLESMLSAPVLVINDCLAAAWGEHLERGVDNLVYLTLSTGIGAGAVVNGNLLLGKDGNAHEVGHIVVDYKGRRCGCGGRGHWEALASGRAIPRFARELAASWEGESEAKEAALKGELDPPELFSLWREGDSFANFVVEELARVNAAGIATVVNVYDPEVVVLGGGIALNNPDFIELTLSRLDEYVTNRKPSFKFPERGEDAVLFGVALTLMEPPPSLNPRSFP